MNRDGEAESLPPLKKLRVRGGTTTRQILISTKKQTEPASHVQQPAVQSLLPYESFPRPADRHTFAADQLDQPVTELQHDVVQDVAAESIPRLAKKQNPHGSKNQTHSTDRCGTNAVVHVATTIVENIECEFADEYNVQTAIHIQCGVHVEVEMRQLMQSTCIIFTAPQNKADQLREYENLQKRMDALAVQRQGVAKQQPHLPLPHPRLAQTDSNPEPKKAATSVVTAPMDIQAAALQAYAIPPGGNIPQPIRTVVFNPSGHASGNSGGNDEPPVGRGDGTVHADAVIPPDTPPDIDDGTNLLISHRRRRCRHNCRRRKENQLSR